MPITTPVRMLALAAAFAASSSLAGAQQVKWDMPNEYQANSIPGQADQEFGKLLKEYSGGKIEVIHHFGGSLGYKSRDHFTAVEDGAVPLASTYAGTFIGMDPIWAYQSIPFLATKLTETRASIGVVRPYINRVLGKAGQFMLMAEPWTPVGIWANKPITSIDAIKNLKIRTYDSNGTEAMRAAGASPIQMSWADVIPALATGTIEAVLTSDEGGVSAKFWEHTSHFTNLNFTMGVNTVHMNIAEFDKLPMDLKRAVMRAATDAESSAWKRSGKRIGENIQKLKDNGVTYIAAEDVPQEVITHLQKASAPLLAKWREAYGAEADLILAQYFNAIGR